MANTNENSDTQVPSQRTVHPMVTRRRGMLAFALNLYGANYVRLAYALALSAKATQRTASDLSVVVLDPADVPSSWRAAFDAVIPLAEIGADLSHPGRNAYRAYQASPYEETVLLDADTLLGPDLSPWWAVLEGADIAPTKRTVDHCGHPYASNPYLALVSARGLPEADNGVFFFRRSATAEALFKAAHEIAMHWEDAAHDAFGRPNLPYASDIVLSLALAKTGIQTPTATVGAITVPTFVNMKPRLIKMPESEDFDWRPRYPFTLGGRGEIAVGGVPLPAPLHYHLAHIISDALIAHYERVVGL